MQVPIMQNLKTRSYFVMVEGMIPFNLWQIPFELVLLGFDQSRYKVLGLAKSIFRGTPIAEKLSGIHWHFKSASHAVELTAGFYNLSTHDVYMPITSMLKKHGAA